MFNMKVSKKLLNLRQAFEEKRDFDFSIYYVKPDYHCGFGPSRCIKVNSFTLFGITVTHARKIANQISMSDSYVCSVSLALPEIVE